MTTLRERNIEIEIPDALSGRKFDDWTHGLSHCMKAVDFIVELTDRILFIEIKDPPDPASLLPNAKGDYVEKFLSGEEDADFYRKYRDSLPLRMGGQTDPEADLLSDPGSLRTFDRGGSSCPNRGAQA